MVYLFIKKRIDAIRIEFTQKVTISRPNDPDTAMNARRSDPLLGLVNGLKESEKSIQKQLRKCETEEIRTCGK